MVEQTTNSTLRTTLRTLGTGAISSGLTLLQQGEYLYGAIITIIGIILYFIKDRIESKQTKKKK